MVKEERENEESKTTWDLSLISILVLSLLAL